MNLPPFLPRDRLHHLIDAVQARGYACVAPQVVDGAILYRELTAYEQLPQGITQEQEPGSYRLIATDSQRHFSWANGPQALKPLSFAPREDLWIAEQSEAGTLVFRPAEPKSEPIAVFGVRACDLAALALQDQHFNSDYPDPYYRARREKLLLIGVHCTHPAATCFCASTGDGPEIHSGADITLYETDQGYFVEAQSEQGATVLAGLPLEQSTESEYEQARQEVRRAADQQRSVPGTHLKETLFAKLEDPHWAEIAERCLSCGNCTQVCPTCFCHSESEVPAVDGATTHHQRQWDSCFTPDHSYIHGLHVRQHTKERYRQWLTHKFGSWHDQYGRSGCVGCGRCISWCPVGIDPTEELAVLCSSEQEVAK